MPSRDAFQEIVFALPASDAIRLLILFSPVCPFGTGQAHTIYNRIRRTNPHNNPTLEARFEPITVDLAVLFLHSHFHVLCGARGRRAVVTLCAGGNRQGGNVRRSGRRSHQTGLSGLLDPRGLALPVKTGHGSMEKLALRHLACPILAVFAHLQEQFSERI